VRAQPDIVNALRAAERRGVAVRGVVDSKDAACTSFEYADTPALVATLGADRIGCDRGSAIMHNKFFVLDSEKVWTGSTNISDTELGGEYNSDVAVMLYSKAVAAVYEAEFEEMHSGLFHGSKSDNTTHSIDPDGFSEGTVIESYFSPTDGAIVSAVIPLINSAHHTLDVAMFFFTSRPIAAAILDAKQRGVVVRMILDAGGAANRYSQHVTLCDNGIAVKIENWGSKSHSKWAVADAELDDAAVVFGSMNWTDSGDDKNDENTLYLRNPGVAAEFHTEFERQWEDLLGVAVCAGGAVRDPDSARCRSRQCGTP
jgi:phosphatidylserine/phosphatidylglycerophosphate/cardiolipin synthase-like enzyme